jgi:hypothetical protein
VHILPVKTAHFIKTILVKRIQYFAAEGGKFSLLFPVAKLASAV